MFPCAKVSGSSAHEYHQPVSAFGKLSPRAGLADLIRFVRGSTACRGVSLLLGRGLGTKNEKGLTQRIIHGSPRRQLAP